MRISSVSNTGLSVCSYGSGSKIYSDIGDAPTAIKYFSDALDELPEGENDGLRAVILGQTGSLTRVDASGGRYPLSTYANPLKIEKINDIPM